MSSCVNHPLVFTQFCKFLLLEELLCIHNNFIEELYLKKHLTTSFKKKHWEGGGVKTRDTVVKYIVVCFNSETFFRK